MDHWWIMMKVDQCKRADLMQRVEHERLIQQVQYQQQKKRRLNEYKLNWLKQRYWKFLDSLAGHI